MTVPEPVRLSVVVASYTLERLNDIFKLLDGIKAQTYKSIETVIVVDGSESLLRQIESYANLIALPNTRFILNKGERGASAARNLGIREARGDIIGFIDDDAVPFDDWAEEMVRSYDTDTVIGVTGPAVPLWEDDSMSWFPEELHWIVSCTTWFDCKEVKSIRHVWFENASFRKEAFTQAGYLDTTVGPHDSTQGFKESEFRNGTISDDLELSLRVKARTGKAIVYNPKVRVWHKVDKKRLQMSYIRKWSYWTGRSKSKLGRMHSKGDKSILSPEHQLLKRIFTKLFPNIVKTSFSQPRNAWRKLSVTVNVLFFVALGYCFPRRLLRRTPDK
jgi:glycosyltransferase involved in cell wall biosynthesis